MQKTKTIWNLGLHYKSPTDPKLEKDVRTIETAHIAFEKKYKDKTDYLKTDKALLKALEDNIKMHEGLSYLRPLRYLNLFQDIDSKNKEVDAKINVLTQRLTKSGNKLLFFHLNISKMDKKLQQKFLRSKILKNYHYYLKVAFDHGSHQLSEAEERIMSLKGLPSYDLWVRAGEKTISKLSVSWHGKNAPIPEAQNILATLNLKDRRMLQKLISEKLYSMSNLSEAELNAVIIDKKINDELRGYKKPYSATVLGYENSEESVIGLVNAITKHFHISHRFYKAKQKMLKLPHLEYEDRAAKVGSLNKQISFEKSIEIVLRAFEAVDPKYPEILNRYLKNGQIDVFPKKGKRGGAYCASSENSPTFVLLNHVPDMNSVMTLAHEMGHAFHAELSKSQPYIYQSHTISVAEVASTLFEAIVFDNVFETLSEKEKIIALHDKIQDDIQTIFRQIACFNFELDLHTQIREKGSLSKEDIAVMMNKHMKAYLGPAFKMKEKDGYFFVSWPHLRYFFYVYSYAYGQIISKAIYEKYKKNKSYLTEIEKFLSAGGSKSPEEIFKDIGIDTSKPEFFVKGLKSIEQDIKKLESLI